MFIWRKNSSSGDEDDVEDSQQAPERSRGRGRSIWIDQFRKLTDAPASGTKDVYPPATLAPEAKGGDLGAPLLTTSNSPRDEQADAMFANLMGDAVASGQADYNDM